MKSKMKSKTLAIPVSIIFLMAFTLAAFGGVTNPDTLKELDAVRQATKQYKNAELPTWDSTAGGYVQASPRVPGMGYHYANFGLVDNTFDMTAPEVLLYEDAGNGRRLVAVEYIVITGGGPPSGFTGTDDAWGPPPPGEFPPGTWTLHVWLWQGNPDGIFAAFNPNL